MMLILRLVSLDLRFRFVFLHVFMPPPRLGIGGGIKKFLGCPLHTVRPSVRMRVCAHRNKL